MNKEIKEILDRLLKYFKKSNINDFGYEEDKLISYEEAQIILDYITNLKTIEQQYSALLSENAELENKIINLEQEKNEEFDENCKLSKWLVKKQKRIEELEKENQGLKYENTTLRNDFKNQLEYTNELKSRIDKAVEYIKEHTENIDRGQYYEDYVETYDLLNILTGGSNE